MGKGSRQRRAVVSQTVVADNWDLIFRKKDMQIRVKENSEEFGSCGCGRSPIGKCIGWHGLSEEAFQDRKEKYETGQVDLSGKEV
jgi:hypothetical protein